MARSTGRSTSMHPRELVTKIGTFWEIQKSMYEVRVPYSNVNTSNLHVLGQSSSVFELTVQHGKACN